ncbi:MAG: GIY-YIG nuclease family protein [Lachnospiraceae bacterium]|nr:GIY-YIG nuclease family protein [Lachnospiraceae bacterium]
MEFRNYTYIIECRDGKLYTGWTNCIERRLSEHNSGRGARFTRGRGPVQLRYLEISETKSDAMKREAAIKKLTHAQKKQLISQGELKKILAEYNILI